jgi:hypothetical protein
VLDQAEQVGAGRGQRTARVVLGETVELPDHGVAGDLQVSPEIVFRVGDGHRTSLPLAVFLPIANPDTNQHAADENVNRRT